LPSAISSFYPFCSSFSLPSFSEASAIPSNCSSIFIVVELTLSAGTAGLV
jgi:hypothetical protein